MDKINFENTNKIELLAPAGSYEAFLMALKNGADAVYLAGNRFGARAYAGNFEQEDLIKALDKAHLFNKKIYLTVNTVLKNEEMLQLYDFIYPYYCNGLDGVIVQDIGVAAFLNREFPDMELHASTQMSISDTLGASFLKKNGFCRVVPARELSLKEIDKIIKETGIEVECFIHGAMCYAYSGKCLFSSFLGERSGNRGRCAQPCRLMYNSCYPLSMKDMYTLNILPDLIKTGICSFKIEGRMKSPDYVGNVTGIYRKYIDLYYENPDKYKVSSLDENLLLSTYTRSGNCSGYYYERNGKNLITLSDSAYNGERNAKVDTSCKSEIKKLGINGYACFKKGEKATLTVNYKEIYVNVSGDMVEASNNKPIDEASIRRQLMKTGADDFYFEDLNIELQNDIFVPLGRINELRRNALSKLKFEVLNSFYRKKIEKTEPKRVDNNILDRKSETSDKIIVSATACDYSIFVSLLKYKYLDEVIIPWDLAQNVKDNKVFKEELYSSKGNKKLSLKLPLVIRSDKQFDKEYLTEFTKEFDIRSVFVCNYEEIELLNEIGFEGDVIAGEHLYCLNNESVKALRECGVSSTTVPLELNKNELYQRNIKGENLITYGKAPLMITAGCINKTLYSCKMKNGFNYLEDRKSVKFPVYNICSECTNIIYNSVPSFIERDNELIDRLEINRMILSFSDEKETFAKRILDYYCLDDDKPEFEYTRGHLNRGVE